MMSRALFLCNHVISVQHGLIFLVALVVLFTALTLRIKGLHATQRLAKPDTRIEIYCCRTTIQATSHLLVAQ